MVAMSLEEFQSAVAKVMDDNAGSSDAVTGQETEASVDEAVVTDQTVTEDTSASTQKFVGRMEDRQKQQKMHL